MFSSEIWLITHEREELTEPDREWLEHWLSESLGVSVRVIVLSDPSTIEVPEAQPVIYDGDAEFIRRSRERQLADAIREEASPTDWLVLACHCLRGDEPLSDAGAFQPHAVLDRWILALRTELDRRFPRLFRAPFWPSPYRCAVVLTHDIDAVDRWSSGHVRHLARHVGERFPLEGWRAVARLPWALLRGLWDSPPIGDRVSECVALERARGVTATYLFFAPDHSYRSAFDGWYVPDTRLDRYGTVKGLWQELLASGFEIGLHLSIGAHADPQAIDAEWCSLKSYVPNLSTYRSHSLKQKPGVTVDALAAAGARIDLNVVSAGFSRGSGLPWRRVEREGRLYYLPTVLEDSPLEAGGAEPSVLDDLWRRWEFVLEETERNGSLATVLLHPENPGANELLKRVIGWGNAHDAWMVSAAGLIAHWEARRASCRRESAETVEIAGASSR